MAYNYSSVEIPDNDYWRKQINCQYACPVNTDSRGYVRAIAEGDFEKAYLIARAPNPLASMCGRVCGAPCEAACRRGELDDAVSIRALKRFVTNKFGSESGKFNKAPLDLIKSLLKGRDECEGVENIQNYLERFGSFLNKIPDDAFTVGIIGSGPAGLAAAHDLCLMGIKPCIYEMEPVAAGMLYLGVPEYRLPRNLIEAEIDVIKALGTEIYCNVKVGEDITLQELRKKHDAVLIAVGAKKSRKIPIPNVDAEGVFGGVDFLRDIALNEKVELGEKIIVIGGGNVAYDVARTVVRQTQYDVSRTALRQMGVKEVHLVSLESFEEMPADDIEIHEGEEEGVIRHNSLGPREILVDDSGRVKGARFIKCLSVFDENGKFSPKFDESISKEIFADSVILSIGQSLDLSFIDPSENLLTDTGLLKLDEQKIKTNQEWLFAAGDVALGPGLMIDAIASGKSAARNIFAYLNKTELQREVSVNHEVIDDYFREPGYETEKRRGVPVIPPEERKKAMNLTVERGYTKNDSICQAGRCFDCGVNTIFDSDRCILCGGCADVCPEACLRLVSVGQIESNETFQKLVNNRYGEMPLSTAGAIIKDETICIRCGLCAERCPVDAITMEKFNFREVYKNA